MEDNRNSPHRTQQTRIEQMRTKIQEKRLLKLCDFLEKLPPKKFNFATTLSEEECGTVGCAIGWTPMVFPRSIKVGDKMPSGEFTFKYANGDTVHWTNIPDEFFRVPYELFSPFNQRFQKDEAGLCCGPSSTPKQVAKMLRRYTKLNPIPTKSAPIRSTNHQKSID